MLESSKKIKKSHKKSKKQVSDSDSDEEVKPSLNMKFVEKKEAEIRDIYRMTRRGFTTSLVIPSSIVDNA